MFTEVNITEGVNYITVNTGLEGCNINARSLDNGQSYNNSGRNVSSFTFNTTVRPLLVTITKSKYLPYTAMTGGTLNADFTIDENLNVFGNLIVANGVHIEVSNDKSVSFNNDLTINGTLTLNPGTELFLGNDASLIINGTFIAQGGLQEQITLGFDDGEENAVIINTQGYFNVNTNLHCYGNINAKNGSIITNTNSGKIFMHDEKKINIEGVVFIYSQSANKLELDFIDGEDNGGIFAKAGSFLAIGDCIIRNSGTGIYNESGISEINIIDVDFYDCGNYCVNITGSSTNTPEISGCTFNDSYGGIMATNLDDIIIYDNQFDDVEIGINTSNVTEPFIFYNTLASNSNSLPGIFLTSSDGIIYQNEISGFTNGIHLGNSSPIIGQNEITDNLYHGIFIGTGSLPVMNGQVYDDPPEYYAISGYNNIIENGGTTTGGPSDNDGSEIWLSNSTNADMEDGCNSIVDDRGPGGDHPPYNTQLLMNADGGGTQITVHAEGNFWGDSPYYELSRRFGNLRVYYTPYYNDPCEYEENQDDGLVMVSSDGSVIDTLYPQERTVSYVSGTELLYSKANKKLITGDYEGAELIYNQIINSNDTLFAKLKAYIKLYVIGKQDSRDESYFSNLYDIFSSLSESTEDSLIEKIFSQLGSLSLVGQAEYVSAIEEFDNVVQNNPGTEEALYAEIDALTTALLIEQDSTLGKTSAQNYAVNKSEYQKRIKNILLKNFSAEQNIEEIKSLPENYQLYQNFPNPFNPVTNIKYDIIGVQDVRITIYDILGREVVTLVNEQQQPGSYTVNWNASTVSSGIYFYQLKTKDYVDTKKMILLK